MKNFLRISGFVFFLTTTAFSATVFAASDTKPEPLLPLELFCSLHKTGKALDCYYSDGKTKKVLNDQDLLEFINAANKGVYVTVRSKKGYERVYFLDPNGTEFKNFYKIQKSPTVSMRELGQAKYAVFAAIEEKVIKISNSLDAASPSELVTTDPAFAYLKFKNQLIALKTEKDEIEKSCEKYKNSDVEKNLEAALQEKRVYTHYLSLLVKTMSEPGSCTETFKLKPNEDGSISLDGLNDLSSLFQQKCHLADHPAHTESNELYDKYAQQKTKDHAAVVCGKTYDQGPFIIAGAAGAADRTFCYGLTVCGKDKEKGEKMVVSCAATVKDGHYTCPAPDHCNQSKDVFIFNKDIQAAAP